MLDDQARTDSLHARRRVQQGHDQTAGPRIAELRAQGMGWRSVARALDAEGMPTPQGGHWHATQAQRIARRYANLEPEPLPESPTAAPAASWWKRPLAWLTACLTSRGQADQAPG